MAYAVPEARLYKTVSKLREEKGRAAEPSAAVVDTQRVKSAAGVREQSGYDGGKKVKGRKRSLATDTQGNGLAVGMGSAAEHDKGAVKNIEQQAEG